MNYKLQNRYQDSGWENLNEECSHLETAKHRAHELSKNSIAYGMVRVVNIATGTIEAEYPAGGEATSKPPEELQLWHEYTVYIDGLTGQATIPICGLCGNTGYVSTLNIRTSNGELVPTIRQPCICPNGRAMKGGGDD